MSLIAFQSVGGSRREAKALERYFHSSNFGSLHLASALERNIHWQEGAAIGAIKESHKKERALQHKILIPYMLIHDGCAIAPVKSFENCKLFASVASVVRKKKKDESCISAGEHLIAADASSDGAQHDDEAKRFAGRNSAGLRGPLVAVLWPRTVEEWF